MSEIKIVIAPPTREQYERRCNQIMYSYRPTMYPCQVCQWPVVEGFCCDTCGTSNPR